MRADTPPGSANQEPTRPDGRERSGPVPASAPIRLLLVDDTATVHLTLVAMLATRSGGRGASRRYSVDLLQSVDEGLEALRRGAHDCYLVDHRVGEKSGVEMIRRARADGLMSPIIMLTGTELVEGEAAEAGANDFLVKGSFDTTLLERSIRYAIGNAEMLRRLSLLNASLESQVIDRTRRHIETNERLTEQIAARERAEAALLRAGTLEALGRMTGQVAHDFNNILTALFGSLEQLQNRLGQQPDPRLARPLDHAREAARRGERMVDGLLAFARRQPIAPTPNSVNEVIAASGEVFRMILGDGVALATELAPGLPPVAIDRDQLERALLNLIGNACDALDGSEAPRIVVSTGLDAAARDGSSMVRIEVSDNGPGMSPDVLARAFEPLFSTKDPGRGTGLGLAQVYGFAQASGGTAEIDNRPGDGISIILRIPAAEPA